jgi:hypothetical protein
MERLQERGQLGQWLVGSLRNTNSGLHTPLYARTPKRQSSIKGGRPDFVGFRDSLKRSLKSASEAPEPVLLFILKSKFRIISEAVSFETMVDLGGSRQNTENPLILSR